MNRIIIITFFSSFIFGEDILKKQNPCSHPLIKLARENGIKAVPIKDVFKYRRLIKECKKSGNPMVSERIQTIDWERDFKRSKSMSNWTSTHAMLTVVFVGYYYMAKILDIPYDVTFFPKNK
ncbi:MAG: hypothetical protein CMG63_04335 [Candidatus Marinimicrobia bacterium]|nr:hypothetical protein [Candidatus Neomarinimicrobiota bacterium]|tara:strand:+ start:690 stop:1055 length:366 start_codon:yes stop_codon:yes gene_type:complete